MVAVPSVGYDATRLTLVAWQMVGLKDPKACRKLRRRVVAAMNATRAMPAVRAEAIRGMERSCGACGGCKGISPSHRK